MKHNLKYFDGNEINELFEENEIVKIQFFFEDRDYPHNKTKLYKAYRISDDLEVILEDYKFVHDVLGSEKLVFKMPKEDIYLKYTFIDDESIGTLTVDDSGIYDLEYGNNPGDNQNFKSCVTDALFSDDYDIGLTDHYFCGKTSVFNFHIKKDLKIKLCLIKDINVVVELNGISYKFSSKEAKEIIDNNNEKANVFVYTYMPIKFEKSGTISFNIEQ